MSDYIDNVRLTKELGEWARTVRGQILKQEPTDKMTDYIAESVYLICNNMSYKSSFINYCVDKDTEALTKRGWLDYRDITTNDIILSYDKDIKRFVWSSIKDLYISNYKGLMHQLKIKGMDALVTPNHKFLTTERGLISTELLLSKDNVVLFGDYLIQKNEIYDDLFVELIGWIITEGHIIERKKVNNIHISQKEGDFADRIRECLNGLNIPYKEYYRKNGLVTWFLKDSEMVRNIYTALIKKNITSEFILLLSQRQREILIKTMINGDGWIRPSGGYGYCQKDKYHIDQFLFLCTIAGKTTNTTLRNIISFGKPTTIYNVNIYNSPKLYCKVENIDFNEGFNSFRGGNSKNNYKEQHPNNPTIEYDDIIWCPRTEYGCFVCRRNGSIYITGNTYKDDMVGDAIENCVRYLKNFDNEKYDNAFGFISTIVYYAFVRRIKKENRRHLEHLQYIKKVFTEDNIMDSINADNPQDVSGYQPYIDHMQSILDDMDIAEPEEHERKKREKKNTPLDDILTGEKY